MSEQSAARMLEAMSAKGLRITDQRRTIARLFADAAGFLSPKEIYLELEQKHPGLSYDTVYRNLRVMQELDIVEQLNLEEGIKFRMRCLGSHSHHHHFICLDCHLVSPLEFCPMDYLNMPGSIEVVKHRFEVYGYCMNCRKQEKQGMKKRRSA